MYVFFNWPGDSKHLGSAGQQADKYIAPGGKFFMFFMYLILPMNQVTLREDRTYLRQFISIMLTTRYQSKTIRGNYDYDRELSSIDTVPAYILSKFYVFGQGKCQLSVFFLRNKYTRFYGRQHAL